MDTIRVFKTHEANGRWPARWAYETDGACGTGYLSEEEARAAAQAWLATRGKRRACG